MRISLLDFHVYVKHKMDVPKKCRTMGSVRASPTVSVEFKISVEFNSENEFSSTGNLSSTETVGDARQLTMGSWDTIVVLSELTHNDSVLTQAKQCLYSVTTSYLVWPWLQILNLN